MERRAFLYAIAAVALAVVVVVVAYNLMGGGGGVEEEGGGEVAGGARWVAPEAVRAVSSFSSTSKLDLALRLANGVDPTFRGVSAPMWYDDYEQAYMILLTVGDRDIALVFDTGSASLMVKDESCRHRGRACPVSNNAYLPSSSAVALRAPHERPEKTTFGSQTVFSKPYLDTVKMQGVVYGTVKVHSISRIEGTTTSNVMGMAPYVMGRDGERKSLADELFRSKPEKAFTLDLINDYGIVYFTRARSVDPQVRLHRAPLVAPPSFASFSTRFYTIQFSTVTTDAGRVYDGRKDRGVPRYLMIDTGTTHTYLPRAFARMLAAHGWVNGRSGMTFNFDGGAQWCLPASLYNDEHNTSSLIGFGNGGRNAFDEAFGDTGAILVGAIAMRRTVWEHDLENMTMGWYQKQEGCVEP